MAFNVNRYQNLTWPKYDSLKEYFDYSTNSFGKNKALVELKTGKEITYKQLRDSVIKVAYGLNKLLDGKKTHCAIISENCALYIMAYFSIFNSNNVAVLIDNELNDESMYKQINVSDCELIFLSENNIAKIDKIKKNCKKVKHIIVLSDEENKKYNTYASVGKVGKDNIKEAISYHENLIINSFSLAQILFTSGTTGANKGVMLSNKNICCSIFATIAHFYEGHDTISLLPFHHAYEMSCHILPIFVYGTTNYINDSLLHMMNNLKKAPATLTAAVPLVPETMAKRILSEVRKTRTGKYLWQGIKVSNLLRKFHIDVREKFFETILSSFNENFRYFGCGGAPIKSETYDLLDGIGFHIIAGYGITECSPLVACNYWHYQRKGSAGHVVPNVQVKIANKREDGNGDILVKGDGVMLGYYKDDESTHKVLSKDGWLNTGDIGHLDNDGFIYICGRSKNLIILPNGKNVFPEEIDELLMDNIKYIDECLVYADKDETGIYATVCLSKSFAKNKKNEDLYDTIKKDLVAFNKKMPAYKRISDIRIRQKEFKKNSTKKIIRNSSNMFDSD